MLARICFAARCRTASDGMSHRCTPAFLPRRHIMQQRCLNCSTASVWAKGESPHACSRRTVDRNARRRSIAMRSRSRARQRFYNVRSSRSMAYVPDDALPGRRENAQVASANMSTNPSNDLNVGGTHICCSATLAYTHLFNPVLHITVYESYAKPCLSIICRLYVPRGLMFAKKTHV